MRASHSLSLADSMLVKAILDVSRELVDTKWAPRTIEVQAPVEGSQGPKVRVLLPLRIPSGPVIRIPPVEPREALSD
jgi:hypothetical protein